jgi:serine/threonine-protein kinase HipA
MAASELVVLLADSTVGVVRRDSRARLTFAYEPSWADAEGAYPISLSMPLAAREHGHREIDTYLWGLLPDNDVIIQRWAQSFQVSAQSAFALLQHVGEECPGAIRFARPERVSAIAEVTRGRVDWLDEHDIADRLRALRRDVSAWRQSTDAGQFSAGRGTAQNGAAVRWPTMGRSLRPHADDPHPQTKRGEPRWPRGK